MDSIGAEVGQKMRSAIKAKLTELDCYVDDELPDYIMVMVANKRSKSQMNEDLNLFLNNKTSTFVDWLHVVLKKLEEVTVTNAEIYKRVSKRKSSEGHDNVKVKKEKKEKKSSKKQEKIELTVKKESSLTDNLPLNINHRKITVNQKKEQSDSDGFDIPLLSEVNDSNEHQLEEIQKKIKNVKSRLGLLVNSDDELDEELLQIKKEALESKNTHRKIQVEENRLIGGKSQQKDEDGRKAEHKRIIYTKDDEKTPPKNKKESVLSRLGKRESENHQEMASAVKIRKRIDLSGLSTTGRHNWRNRNDDKKRNNEKESVLSRLGVMSKVSVPERPQQEPEMELSPREVRSMITVKPRKIPKDVPQANKNLLLKAMADAQRSIAQTPTVGKSVKAEALFTKKYVESVKQDKQITRKLPETAKNKLKTLLTTLNDNKNVDYNSGSEEEYVPQPVKRAATPETEENIKQNFVVTLDGYESKLKTTNSVAETSEKSQKSGKRSPIIFDLGDSQSSTVKSKSNIPDKLPLVSTPVAIKNKERCKYWPNCRQGEKCEFLHPNKPCEMFPHCKFGDKCLYIHPTCKFGSSCTRRECPYNHMKSLKNNVLNKSLTNVQYAEPCKFGKFCKKGASCSFSHGKITAAYYFKKTL